MNKFLTLVLMLFAGASTLTPAGSDAGIFCRWLARRATPPVQRTVVAQPAQVDQTQVEQAQAEEGYRRFSYEPEATACLGCGR